MFEEMTYENILERMLSNVPIDMREGSVVSDAISPCAAELAQMYIELEIIIKESFADTASREFLIKRAAERGIKPTPSSNAILKAQCTPPSVSINTGERFNFNGFYYEVIGKIEEGNYKVRCENKGSEGNRYLGALIPVQYIKDLEEFKLTEVLVPAEDEEETEHFRQRYFDSFASKAFGGNEADYIEFTNAISGVGATKITPVWDGGGTVKVTILDSEYNPASPTLISTVQTAIDPSVDGKGKGIAPIGHIVTVDTASKVTVDVQTSIVFDSGKSWEGLKDKIKNLIKDYLLEIRKTWDKTETPTVRISQIKSKIINCEGVIDVENTTINGSAENLILTKYQIPIMGEVTNG